ncbi:hypothetical protein [Novibacillus thermophilus]|uniref:Uncharacterized protein n=1 Tax=Novibacillus thermophilus TaxID=1471761 RepID=A0A1U9K6J0_9BACL|nr:hypothetical protein [Novibacillus thermophilus]AQS55677.1 hypothetical protein B0W44_07630 [Novibacillus thermophilus]
MGVVRMLLIISLVVGVIGAFIAIWTEIGETFAAIAIASAALWVGIRYGIIGKTKKTEKEGRISISKNGGE